MNQSSKTNKSFTKNLAKEADKKIAPNSDANNDEQEKDSQKFIAILALACW
ncbi:MAG: hypothetical protein JXR07_03400 [Reichenbachiella sp.]